MGLDRFVKAHERSYNIALGEIKRGRKESHWMWYIFPQLKGLGHSEMSRYYALKDREEAEEFLSHPVLGKHLREITSAILNIEKADIREVFGFLDSKKLKSCMTLFYLVSEEEIFIQVLEKFFDGEVDKRTEVMLQ